MDKWKDIKTAPTDREILVARIDENGYAVYAVMVRWETLIMGYIQKASVSGWYIEGIPLRKNNEVLGNSIDISYGMLSMDANCHPTHWKDF
jgi:hypothetical protein